MIDLFTNVELWRLCEFCKTEFVPEKNHPHQKFCKPVCKQLALNERRKIERRKAQGAEGMEQAAFRKFRQPKTHDRPLTASPQRTYVHRIAIPPIAPQFEFLYQNGRSGG